MITSWRGIELRPVKGKISYIEEAWFGCEYLGIEGTLFRFGIRLARNKGGIWQADLEVNVQPAHIGMGLGPAEALEAALETFLIRAREKLQAVEGWREATDRGEP